jgi:hypothetical protein
MTTSGDRLVVSLGGSGPECRSILIVDMRTGKTVGELKLSDQ